MVLLRRFELRTSPLPRECSTPELQQPTNFGLSDNHPTNALLVFPPHRQLTVRTPNFGMDPPITKGVLYL